MKTGICILYILLINLHPAKAYHANDFNSDPILILARNDNFGLFTAEILKTEGFNEIQIQQPTDTKLNPSYLKNFDIIILAETIVTTKMQSMLTKYVNDGGNLIAFRPDKKLSLLFGITDISGKITDGYVAINTSEDIGKGLVPETLQFHGEADMYMIQGGRKIAALYKDAFTKTEFPSVVFNDFGKGHAIAFAYNLPQSIVYTRQGNYRNAGQEMDGITGIRAMDMFTDGWIDTTKNTLNQADEQMRLLSHCIERMSRYKKPLPRFWYFPDTLKCLVTLNNDGEDNKEADFQKQFEDVDSKGAKMTLYVKEVDLISKAWINTWMNKGFEMAGHYDDTKQAINPDWKTMDSVYKSLNDKLKSEYGIDSMRTVTNHWFVWCGKDENGKKDFSAQARIEEKNGIRLDCNYAHYDNGSNQGHFLGAFGTNQGNYTGSGLVMNFSDQRGNIINLYQQLNNVYDQQYMEHDDKDGFYNCFKGLMDRSLNNGVYSFICVKAHNAEYFFSEIPLMKMLDYANSKRIPVWTQLKLLDFLKAKEAATFSNLTWKNSRLSFKIKSPISCGARLSYLVPYTYNGKRIGKITSNGLPQSWSIESIKGSEYAWLTITPGNDYSIAVDYVP